MTSSGGGAAAGDAGADDLPLHRRRPPVAPGFVVLVTLPVAGRVLSASLRRANPPAVVVEL
jgi:hypothetical protein